MPCRPWVCRAKLRRCHLTSYRIWMYKQVVNVLPLSDNHARGYSLMRSRRETGLCGSTESAAGSSLSRFQGRCLLVGAGPVWHRQPFAAVVGNTRVDRLRITTQRRFDSAGVHPQAPFCRQGAATPAKHRMSSGHPVKRCAYWQAGARTCRRYRRNRATVVILASSPYEKGALEIEACHYGSGSPSQDGRSGEYHPLGLPYGPQ